MSAPYSAVAASAAAARLMLDNLHDEMSVWPLQASLAQWCMVVLRKIDFQGVRMLPTKEGERWNIKQCQCTSMECMRPLPACKFEDPDCWNNYQTAPWMSAVVRGALKHNMQLTSAATETHIMCKLEFCFCLKSAHLDSTAMFVQPSRDCIRPGCFPDVMVVCLTRDTHPGLHMLTVVQTQIVKLNCRDMWGGQHEQW